VSFPRTVKDWLRLAKRHAKEARRLQAAAKRENPPLGWSPYGEILEKRLEELNTAVNCAIRALELQGKAIRTLAELEE